MTTFSTRLAAAAAPLAAALLCSCDLASIPKDSEGAFPEARGGVLIVGAVENPPWIVNCNGQPVGLEADLMHDFAREIDAEVRWVWKPLPALMRALQNHELHLVVGGIEKDSPWAAKVGFTRPFADVPLCIGSPPGAPIPEDFEGVQVGIGFGSKAADALRELGAEPVYLDDLWSFQGLAAAPAWELDARGYSIHYPPLARWSAVVAAPKGENQLITRLETFLSRHADVPGNYGWAAVALQSGRPCEEGAGVRKP